MVTLPVGLNLHCLWQGPKKRKELPSVGASPWGLTGEFLSSRQHTRRSTLKILGNKKSSVLEMWWAPSVLSLQPCFPVSCSPPVFQDGPALQLITPCTEGPAENSRVDTQLCSWDMVHRVRQACLTHTGPESFLCDLELGLRLYTPPVPKRGPWDISAFMEYTPLWA